jgi:hypothetical protein
MLQSPATGGVVERGKLAFIEITAPVPNLTSHFSVSFVPYLARYASTENYKNFIIEEEQVDPETAEQQN